jgi:hypothetical protein
LIRRADRQHAFPEGMVGGALKEERRPDADQDRQRNPPAHGRDELMPAALSEIGKADGHDEEGLEPFPESDDECLKHEPNVLK